MSQNEPTTDTMADVSHTNPYTGETAGRLFRRGPTVAADGGQRRAEGGEAAAADSNGRTAERPTETMADVDHTPPHDADDANRVFERGRDHTVDPVEDEE
ncbi:hypothetical protein RBH26_13930 [Natronolimnohabitans sp. A-GB9]|uniref:hypothetical protein n=1 Tax=Natronolimnohabitans sp. A-GB9 TaxID=3069757 RepID=UPI0027AF507E|nr:hypothetical protein [Natronolimnohabitans sp. A-GB9]MDQ2051576.1 hypothetical protein [Natronolimnohabitans sp. A-GB9]